MTLATSPDLLRGSHGASASTPRVDACRKRVLSQGGRKHPTSRVELYPGNCLDVLAKMDSNCIHMVLSDPPYFLDGLDGAWRKGKNVPTSNGAVGGLPIGMKFDKGQGARLQAFLAPIAEQLHRVMLPGAFMLLFSAPRLAHRMALAAESVGFEIRDQFAWRFRAKAQFKAFTQDHFVKRRTDFSEAEKRVAIDKLGGRRTPQLRPQFESIICAQKPKIGTFVDNWLEFETGLIDAKQTLNGQVPSTVMEVEKPVKQRFNGHLTPKPVKLCEHLVRVFSAKGQVVLDPFLGSGTTCVAARNVGRDAIGIDINPEYIEIAERRLEDTGDEHSA